ncbi:putative glycosyl hydrolase, family 18 [Dactylonectria estremocensis]|uniref:chitinase n=1 Tax=Dactylonectria estremocensis TaxID=1079267 RepID=A0A9P9DCU5_9HYPO|nr:putative glycosyl hydrolase, family 18 [Dactylonectria estremocensis]
MILFLQSPLIPLLLAAGSIATAAASQDASLEEWHASVNRTQAVQACPSSCQAAGADSAAPEDLSSWFLFPDEPSVAACNETMLLSFNIQNDANPDGQAPVTAIRGCKAEFSLVQKAMEGSSNDVAAVCSTPNHDIIQASVTMSGNHTSDKKVSLDDLLSAGHQVQNYLSTKKPNCTQNVLTFGYSRSSAIGLFAGAEVYQHGLHADILSRFLEDAAKQESFSGTRIAQLCTGNGCGSDYAVGIISTTSDRLPFVQEVIRTWADGRCVSGDQEDWMTVSLRVPGQIQGSNNATSSSSALSEATHAWSGSRLAARATCKTTEVKANDGCEAVAKRCGIKLADLKKYNSAKTFCNTLVPGQKVCCSAGTLPDPIPAANSDGTCKTKSVISGDSCASMAKKCGLKAADFTKLHSDSKFCSSLMVGQPVCCTRGKLPDIAPKPSKDGSCAAYAIKADDNCATIAVSHGITVEKIETFNRKTWGWNGCKLLWRGTSICLSTGTPPFPSSISDAVCGPQVPGTKKPSSGSSDTWAKLNPCPLNVCCNVWGKCGMTDDFCVIAKAATGAPGTTAKGKNSCISSCGRDVIKGTAPAKTMRVAYFEAWNSKRKCLNMDVNEIDKSKYTHIHFAFADVTSTFNVDVSASLRQFNLFKAMTGIKKIISFGGWDFSTKPGTYNILREAVKPANRATFTSNIIAFVKKHNLDGVDLDWEYPGAPDIPDIPSGDASAGKDYYQTLSGLKTALGTSKSVSFAAPASYWYLKAFPMKEMGSKIDYIIYMTYDLHGQWDYDNKWTSPGCPTGNCLRSHVNITETKDSLSMITKAGVPSNKVVVGVSSYGRSFKMAQAGCTGPTCKFTGSPRVSNAAKGRCTNTAGYISDAEIQDIIDYGKVTKQWTDAGSNILVYNNTEWVAYMDEDTKASRAKLYASYNFAGTSDWAVDLQEFVDGTGEEEDDYDPNYVATIIDHFEDCDSDFTSLSQLKNRKSKVPSYCMDQYLVDVEISIMDDALSRYNGLIDDGYDDRFKVYEEYTKEQVPSQINAFMGNGHAGDYFKCEETKYRTCCSGCNFASCANNCDKSSGCKNGMGIQTITCPTVYKDGSDGIDWLHTTVPNTTFTLQDSDGFYKAIAKDSGIEKSWIKFGDIDVKVANGCQMAGEDIKECQRRQDDWFWNYPQASDNIEVSNPKDVIGKSYDKSKNLLQRLQLLKTIGDLDSQLNWSDLVDAASLPALTIAQALESMEKVVEEAKKIAKAEREAMIANFIGGILFFIPIVGEVAAASSMTAIQAALQMVEAAGEAGLMAYSIVQDPDNAFMTVFSTLAGAGLGRENWGKAATARRDMKDADVKKLGSIKDDLDTINLLRGGSCRI